MRVLNNHKTEEIRALITDIFDGDEVRSALWFVTKNKLLEDFTPKEMIESGRIDKLYNCLFDAVDRGE